MTKIKRIGSIAVLLFITACTIILPSPIIIIRDAAATALPSATITASPSPTATASPTAIAGLLARTLANVNFRSAPNTNNTPLRVILAGTDVRLIGRIADSTWALAVLADGAQGWMYTQNLSIVGNISLLPIVGLSPTPAPTQEPTPTREVGTRISYNVNAEAIPDRAYLKAHLQRLCPTTVLIMNGMAYAVELYEALRACGTLVAHRTYSIYEGSEWVYRAPVDIVTQWQREGHPEIVRYSTNEPSYGGNQSTESFVANQVELMRVARQAGFTVIIGNFSVGTVQLLDIQRGIFDPMIRAIAEYHQYLGLHEYTQTVLAFGTSQWARECLLDRLCVQPARWPTAAQVPMALQFDPVSHSIDYPHYYHFRRGDWWLLRADAIGVARPKIWLTEWGWDSMSDIKPALEPLRNAYGLTKYMRDLRGVNTYELLWHWYFPNWTFAQATCEQIKWGDAIYPPDYIGMNLFTWSINPHWLHTDFSGRENGGMFQLHTCLEG